MKSMESMEVVKPVTKMRASAMLLLAAVVAVALLARPSRANAQDAQETIDKVVQLNREAVALYQKKKFENARKTLKQALDLCAAAGLERHPVAARTHIHLGIVIVGGYGQREIGAKQFSEALQIQPDIVLTPGVASPAVQDVFNETAVAVTPKAATATAAPAQVAEAGEPAEATHDADEPRAAAPVGDEEPPTVARRAAPARSRRADEGNEHDDEDDGADGGRVNSGFQVGVLLGSGAGYASGNGDVNANRAVSSGFAGAKLGHLALEAGYWATPSVMLSLQGRFQKVSGPTTVLDDKGHTYEPAAGAAAVFAAVTWSPGTARLRPFLSGAIGGGRIRHVVTVSNVNDCGPTRNQACIDTVGAGPFLAGLGGGVTYDLGERLSLVAGVNTQVGAPRFTFNIDLNAGVAFRL